VQVSLTATGNVDDFDAAARKDLAQRFAELSNVAVEDVSISIEPASVLILASVRVDDSSSGSALELSLTSQLSSATAASTLLSISVESAPTLMLLTSTVNLSTPPPPAPLIPPMSTIGQQAQKDSDQTDNKPANLIIAFGVGAVSLAILIIVSVALWRRAMTKRKMANVIAQPSSIVPSGSEFDLRTTKSMNTASVTLQIGSPSVAMPIEHSFFEEEEDEVEEIEKQLTNLRAKMERVKGRKSQVKLHEGSASTTKPEEKEEISKPYLITIEAGPVGMCLKEIRNAATVIVSSINDESSAMAQGAKVNSVVLAVNGESTLGLDKVGVIAKVGSAQKAGQPLAILLSEALEASQITQLQELAVLKDQGLLTIEEFVERRNALISGPSLNI